MYGGGALFYCLGSDRWLVYLTPTYLGALFSVGRRRLVTDDGGRQVTNKAMPAAT